MTTTISLKRYKELLDAEAMLDALKAAGVDNWGGYEDAMVLLEEANAEAAQEAREIANEEEITKINNAENAPESEDADHG